jgi:hypothetical protein
MPGVARRATPSAQARIRFTTCRAEPNPCRVSSRPAGPINLDIYITAPRHPPR